MMDTTPDNVQNVDALKLDLLRINFLSVLFVIFFKHSLFRPLEKNRRTLLVHVCQALIGSFRRHISVARKEFCANANPRERSMSVRKRLFASISALVA